MIPTRKAPIIITLHPGEMSRLTDLTVVGDTKGNIYINVSGNSSMAKGGSGDLLTGIIARLLAGKLTAKDEAFKELIDC